MAEFCVQCAKSMGFEPDSIGLIPAEQAETHIVDFLCEGCGMTYVNYLGECVNPDCLEKHGEKK